MKKLTLTLIIVLLLINCGENILSPPVDKESTTIKNFVVGHWNTENIANYTREIINKHTIILKNEKSIHTGYYNGINVYPAPIEMIWKIVREELIIKTSITDSVIYNIEIYNPGDTIFINTYPITDYINKDRLILKEKTVDENGDNTIKKPLFFLRDKFFDKRAL